MKKEKEQISDEDLEKLQEEIKEKNTLNEEQVDTHMREMGFLWDRVNTKLKNDNVCFHTKKPLIKDGEDPSSVKIHVVEANQTEPGIVAFVSLSDEAFKELSEQQKEKVTEKDEKENK